VGRDVDVVVATRTPVAVEDEDGFEIEVAIDDEVEVDKALFNTSSLAPGSSRLFNLRSPFSLVRTQGFGLYEGGEGSTNN
jgi:hypothetical protein